MVCLQLRAYACGAPPDQLLLYYLLTAGWRSRINQYGIDNALKDSLFTYKRVSTGDAHAEGSSLRRYLAHAFHGRVALASGCLLARWRL